MCNIAYVDAGTVLRFAATCFTYCIAMNSMYVNICICVAQLPKGSLRCQYLMEIYLKKTRTLKLSMIC